jgi:hypothetical protein
MRQGGGGLRACFSRRRMRDLLDFLLSVLSTGTHDVLFSTERPGRSIALASAGRRYFPMGWNYARNKISFHLP